MTIHIVVFAHWDDMHIVACYSTPKSANNLATRRNKQFRGTEYEKGCGPYYVEEHTIKGIK